MAPANTLFTRHEVRRLRRRVHLIGYLVASGALLVLTSVKAHAFDPMLRLHPLRVAPDRDLLIDDGGRVVIPPIGLHVGDTAVGHAFIRRQAPAGSDIFELRDRDTGAVKLSLVMLDQAEFGRSKTFAGRTAVGAPVSVWNAEGKLLAQLPPNVLGKEEGRLDAIENMFKPKKPRILTIDGEGVVGFSGDRDNMLLFPNGWQLASSDFKSTYFKGDGVWIGFRKGGAVSLFDVERRARIDTPYDGIDYFAKTLIATKADDKRRRNDHWIIDRTGKPIAGPYDDIKNFDADRALVLKDLIKYESVAIPAHDSFGGASGYLTRDPSSRPLVPVIDPTSPPPKRDAPELFGYRDVTGALVVPIKHPSTEPMPKNGVYAWR
jgi:hypothetical protein